VEESNGQEEKYADITDVVAAALGHEDFPQGPVQRFEVQCLSNGDATWRAWAAGRDVPEGGAYTEHTGRL
jgi:hypothetical protein